jgi:hypothetical protein
MQCPRCSYDNPTDTNYCGRCGQSLSVNDQQATFAYDKDTLQYIMEGIHRGSVIAERYEVIEELGGGGMGTVYKVFDKKINEKVALKLIRPEIAFDTNTVERFSNELRLARKVTHRNICRLYDLGDHGKFHFITMEYVSGQDLKRMIRMTRELSMGTAVAIAHQICEGLAESHRLGVVHRDLKPQNIMIDSDGNVKIMDFGIARSLYSRGVTMTGVLVGTPEYMAPEQAEASDVDHRADIYALGIILYEMVTGSAPFKGETPLSIAIKHREEIPQDPSELNTQVSDDLCGVILKCLEKDKDRRYQSAEALLKDLSRIEQGIPTIERVIPISEKKADTGEKELTVTFRPRRLFVAGVFVVVLAAAVGVIWVIKQNAGAPGRGQESTVAAGSGLQDPQAPESAAEPPTPRMQVLEKTGGVVPSVKFPTGDLAKKIRPEDFADIMKFSKEFFGGDASQRQQAVGIFQLLRLGAANIVNLMSEEDVQELIKSLDQVVGGMEAESPFKQEWESVVTHMKQWEELKKQGQEEAAERHYESAVSKLNHLIMQLQIKESADRTRLAVRSTWTDAQAPKSEQASNLLFDLAGKTVKDADKAYQSRDYDRAGILYTLAGEIFTLSRDCDAEAECVLLLRGLVEQRENKIKDARPRINLNMELEGKKYQDRAEALLNARQYRSAAELLILAIVSFEQSLL